MKPSKIQALSFRDILYGKNCILADQTGSGKTLAYLLPVMQRVLELTRNGTIPAAQPYSPYVVIIAPTTELVKCVARTLTLNLSYVLSVSVTIPIGTF
jgi:ATP-dependent RNA helicase DDX18/HAS1